jgi:hypothetical protein
MQEGDTWCLIAGRFLQETGVDPTDPSGPPTEEDIFDLLTDGDVAAIVNVTSGAGAATSTTLPDLSAIAATAPSTTIDGVSAEDRCAEAALVEKAEDFDQVNILQVGIFTVDDPDPCDCGDHNINCKNFGEIDRSLYPYDRDLPLGEVEHWRVSASADGHPFHIHTNPYLVCPEENPFDPIPVAHWRDTYLVNLNRRVDMITKYNTFTGAFVLHCHKLSHEDEGMMQLLRVCDPATDPTCGDNHWRSCAEGDLDCVQALAATDCAIEGDSVAETFACITALGGPGAVCGANACGEDADCPPGQSCTDYVCAP